jgi:hypothetical protein
MGMASFEHEEAAGPSDLVQCPLCATRFPVRDPRCPECGFHMAAAPERFVLDRRGMWMLVLLVAAVYAVTLAIVAAAR